MSIASDLDENLSFTKSEAVIYPRLFETFLNLGSALPLFLYPHAITGTLGAKDSKTIRRNASSFTLFIPFIIAIPMPTTIRFSSSANTPI